MTKVVRFMVWVPSRGETRADARHIGLVENVEDAAAGFAMKFGTDGEHQVEDIDGNVWAVDVTRSGHTIGTRTGLRVR